MYSVTPRRIINRKEELTEIYWAWSLKSLALGLVTIFLPIYLIKLGHILPTIFAFYVGLNLMRAAIEPFSGMLVARFGPKHIMAASFYVLFLQLAMFLTLPTMHWPLWLVALISALGVSLHFLSLHTDFSKIKRVGQSGSEVSFLNELANVASALGPLVGGVLATFVGIQYSLLAALIILSFAALPLLRTREAIQPTEFDLRRLKLKTIRRDLIAQFGLGMDTSATNILWPLAIFLIVGSYAQVGAITTLSLLLALVVSRLVGRLVDRGYWRKVLTVGTVAEAGINIARAFSSTPLAAILAGVGGELAGGYAVTVPYLSVYYTHADRKERIEYVAVMEMVGELGRATYWAIILAVSLHSINLAIMVGFFLSAAGVLFGQLIRPVHREAL